MIIKEVKNAVKGIVKVFDDIDVYPKPKTPNEQINNSANIIEFVEKNANNADSNRRISVDVKTILILSISLITIIVSTYIFLKTLILIIPKIILWLIKWIIKKFKKKYK